MRTLSHQNIKLFVIKNLELELSGVQSLSTQEMKSVDGGNPIIVAALVGYAVVFAVGFYNGWNKAEAAAN